MAGVVICQLRVFVGIEKVSFDPFRPSPTGSIQSYVLVSFICTLIFLLPFVHIAVQWYKFYYIFNYRVPRYHDSIF